jgi:hypothetical protein
MSTQLMPTTFNPVPMRERVLHVIPAPYPGPLLLQVLLLPSD